MMSDTKHLVVTKAAYAELRQMPRFSEFQPSGVGDIRGMLGGIEIRVEKSNEPADASIWDAMMAHHIDDNITRIADAVVKALRQNHPLAAEIRNLIT